MSPIARRAPLLLAQLVVVVVTVRAARAQSTLAPPPPPGAAGAPEAEVADALFQLRAGAGFARYAEATQGVDFVADVQPFVLIGAEGGFRRGKATLVLQASAGLGTEVDMHASQNGMVVQQNRFWQELYEASPRVRWPVSPRVHLDVGYRLTIQRLHIIKIPGLGDALEVVTVHALEAGFGWARRDLDTGGLAFDLIFGLNRGGADNDRITGESFTALGYSLSARLTRRQPSGLTIDGAFQVRQQDGSSVEQVNFDGTPTTAVWPKNTTYVLLTAIGYRF